MCIGIPMQVQTVEARHAWCEGRGERRLVNTALVGDLHAGDWLLVFLSDARERIDATRAAEVNATLDLVFGAMQGEEAGAGNGDAAFALPSQHSTEQLRALIGARPPTETPT